MRSIEWRYFQLPWMTPNHPKPPHFLHFESRFNMSATGEVRHFKFGGQVYFSVS